MSVNPALKIFQLLHGVWKVNRVITGAGRFEGTAKFEKNDQGQQQTAAAANELEYSEHGLFHFDTGNTPPLDASKKYIYRYLDGDIYVYFTEREELTGEHRFFHKLNINKPKQNLLPKSNSSVPTQKSTDGAVAEAMTLSGMQLQQESDVFTVFTATHLCLEDNYNVTYKLINENEFHIVYDVKGPNKEYISNTKFQDNRLNCSRHS
jgi:hypothetical protein